MSVSDRRKRAIRSYEDEHPSGERDRREHAKILPYSISIFLIMLSFNIVFILQLLWAHKHISQLALYAIMGLSILFQFMTPFIALSCAYTLYETGMLANSRSAGIGEMFSWLDLFCIVCCCPCCSMGMLISSQIDRYYEKPLEEEYYERVSSA